jgi:hypothetical protein
MIVISQCVSNAGKKAKTKRNNKKKEQHPICLIVWYTEKRMGCYYAKRGTEQAIHGRIQTDGSRNDVARKNELQGGRATI